jgi:hypothetical protein
MRIASKSTPWRVREGSSMRDRLLSVDDPAAVVRYLLAHFLFRGRWDDGFGTHLVGMAQAGLVPPLGGTGFTRLWSGCTKLRSGMLYVDPDLTPISSGPGAGSVFARFCRREN